VPKIILPNLGNFLNKSFDIFLRDIIFICSGAEKDYLATLGRIKVRDVINWARLGKLILKYCNNAKIFSQG